MLNKTIFTARIHDKLNNNGEVTGIFHHIFYSNAVK